MDAVDSLIRKIEEKAESIEHRLTHGQAKDYAEYQGLVNHARGLRDAVQIVREVTKRRADGGEDD